ncbi:hypothetical protein [Spiroplasma endosymbiont of Nebria brevicollis]|uniref:hypothetical protein n=1 Tax=Spiroplasma endosymbiont of Nebria brevicollis TaxID=3066284 RepID=UPI00313D5DA8
MPNIQNYQSINSDIENINSESNIDIIYYSIRWNAFKNLMKNGSRLGVLCCFAALTDAYIQNELTEDKFSNFSEFFQRTKTYLSWGLAAISFSILVDKSAFHYVDEVIKDIKELIIGKKCFTNEEQYQKKVKELQEKITILQENHLEKCEELKVFKENILKEIDEKIKNKKFEATSEFIHTKNFIKANSNYNIEHINNFIPSSQFDKQKIHADNEPSTSGYKPNSPKM